MNPKTYQKIGKEFGLKPLKNEVDTDFVISINGREHGIIGYRKLMRNYPELKDIMIFYQIPPIECPDKSWAFWNKQYAKDPKTAKKMLQERLLLVKKFIYEQKLKKIAKDFK